MSEYPYEAIVVLGDKDEIVEYTGEEIVRCKDCKKYNTDDCMMIHGKKMNRNIFAYDYCSYGEVKHEQIH